MKEPLEILDRKFDEITSETLFRKAAFYERIHDTIKSLDQDVRRYLRGTYEERKVQQ